jgi:hypothetical protein
VTDNFQNPLTQKIAGFLNEIGIPTHPARLDGETFLPGIRVRGGALLVDEERLAFPGDLLHEAGHLAVAPARLRAQLSDEVKLPDLNPDVLEMQAIVWSYAAAAHLEIDPRIVFHPQGYKGRAENLLFNFSLGIFPGLNGLEESGLAFSERRARELGAEPFPKMRKWLRD